VPRRFGRLLAREGGVDMRMRPWRDGVRGPRIGRPTFSPPYQCTPSRLSAATRNEASLSIGSCPPIPTILSLELCPVCPEAPGSLLRNTGRDLSTCHFVFPPCSIRAGSSVRTIFQPNASASLTVKELIWHPASASRKQACSCSASSSASTPGLTADRDSPSRGSLVRCTSLLVPATKGRNGPAD
jgi:hypothetical protein